MGAWGYGLFQSDSDLDVLDEISSDVGKCINKPEVHLYHPENHKHVVAKLNDGVFHQILAEYQAKKWNHGVILFGAATMQLGGHISDDDMKMLRTMLPQTPMYDESKAQMQKGLDGYKNDGTAWDFGSKGLIDTMMSMGGGGAAGGGEQAVATRQSPLWVHTDSFRLHGRIHVQCSARLVEDGSAKAEGKLGGGRG